VISIAAGGGTLTKVGSRRRWPAIAVALLASVAVALALAGLRGGTASAGSDVPKTIRIVDFAYKPSTLRIPEETTVSFSNRGRKVHTATLRGSFDSGRIKPGKSATFVFDVPGTYAYHCTIHHSMKGRIIVSSG
jgi:plastocyanin